MKFRNDMGVEYIDHLGTDETIARAARVSTARDQIEQQGVEGLIKYLWRSGHGSPFESVSLQLRLSMPIFVARELVRHRIASLNEVSGRYVKLEPVFYVPSEHRPMARVRGTSPANPVHEMIDPDTHLAVRNLHQSSARIAWNVYENMMHNGVSNEVARNVLPLSIYTHIMWTINARSLMNFLDLRLAPNALFEIQELAENVRVIFEEKFPLTHAAWNESK